jgi:cysteine desulfurase
VYNYKGVTLDGRPIYLDAQATTHLDPRVLDAMMPLWTEQFGNPHSSTHMYGWENDALVEKAREVRISVNSGSPKKQVAKLIGADPKEIIFTSGATESNNIAVKGVARFYKAKKPNIITTVLVRHSFRLISFFSGTQMCA